MGRDARILIPGAYYHIYTRGQRKNPICFNKEDFRRLDWQIFEAFEKFDTELNAYCIMRNHFHLLVRLRNDELWRPIHRIKTLYAYYFNDKYHLSGHVYDGRFKSRVVLDEQYLVRIVYYIHNNPKAKGLVEEPEDYPYSSAAAYKGKFKKTILHVLKFDREDGVNDNEFPVYKNAIGTREEYRSYEKRNSSRYIRVLKEHRIKNRISSDISLFIKNNQISKLEFSQSKWRRDNQSMIYLLVKYLLERGYSQADIAKYLEYSEANISIILKKFK